MTSPGTAPCCSFCGKASAEVRHIVAGAGVYICDECVAVSAQIVADAGSEIGSVDDWLGAPDDRLLEQLQRMGAASAQIERDLQARVAELRRRGVVWARIGEGLGITRQSAWERFARTMTDTDREGSA